MSILWLLFIGILLITYIILDGFDIGIGIFNFFIKKNKDQRQMIRNSIGPVWDANEVLIIMFGAVLIYVFPLFYGMLLSSLFYVFIPILWAFVVRGISFETSKWTETEKSKKGWDFLWMLSSFLLAFMFGVLLANVLRGFTIVQNHIEIQTFGKHYAVFDIFTITYGLISVLFLVFHGANWLYYKSEEEELKKKAKKISKNSLHIFMILSLIAFSISLWGKFSLYQNPINFNISLVLLITVILVYVLFQFYIFKAKNTILPFYFSSALIIIILLGNVFTLYPYLLIDNNLLEKSIAIKTAANVDYVLKSSLYWFIPALLIYVFFLLYNYKIFKGNSNYDE